VQNKLHWAIFRCGRNPGKKPRGNEYERLG